MGNPGPGVKFENEGVGITVEHEAWQAIVLAMDKPIAVGVFFIQGCAQLGDDDKFVLKPICVNGGGFARLQDAYADRRRGVIQTNGEKAALVIEDNGKVAGRTCMTLPGDGLIEYPRMPLSQSTLRSRSDSQRDPFCRRAGKM